MKRIILSIGISILFFVKSFSQQTAEIGPILYGISDTISSGDTITAGFYIKNTGTSVFSDFFMFDIGVYDSAQTAQIIKTKAHPFVISIPVGDSILIQYLDTVEVGSSSNSFRTGNNIVVVWPRSNANSTITGEASATFYLMQLLKIAEKEQFKSNIPIQFIQSDSEILIVSSQPESYVLELWSVEGRNMIVSDNHFYKEKVIKTDSIKKGYYLIAVKSGNDIVSVKKIAIR